MKIDRYDGKQTLAGRDAESWRKQNAEALTSYNRYIERSGLPLSNFRNFQ